MKKALTDVGAFLFVAGLKFHACESHYSALDFGQIFQE